MCNQEGMLRRSCAREVFEDNWSQGGRVCVCVCLCVGRLEGGMGDRGVKEERWPESRKDEETEGGAK